MKLVTKSPTYWAGGKSEKASSMGPGLRRRWCRLRRGKSGQVLRMWQRRRGERRRRMGRRKRKLGQRRRQGGQLRPHAFQVPRRRMERHIRRTEEQHLG